MVARFVFTTPDHDCAALDVDLDNQTTLRIHADLADHLGSILYDYARKVIRKGYYDSEAASLFLLLAAPEDTSDTPLITLPESEPETRNWEEEFALVADYVRRTFDAGRKTTAIKMLRYEITEHLQYTNTRSYLNLMMSEDIYQFVMNAPSGAFITNPYTLKSEVYRVLDRYPDLPVSPDHHNYHISLFDAEGTLIGTYSPMPFDHTDPDDVRTIQDCNDMIKMIARDTLTCDGYGPFFDDGGWFEKV